MTTATRVLAIALALAATAATAAWVTDTSKTITYTLSAQGTAAWSIGNFATGDPGWLTKAWSYNEDMSQVMNGDYNLVTPTVDNALGGVIYHFQATTSQAISVNLSALLTFNNGGGRKGTLYYSDKAWSDLSSPLAGSTWSGWGDEWETNANWIRIDDAAAYFGGDQWITLGGTQLSSDGNFFLRVDLTSAAAPLNSIFLWGENWTAAAVPEPASVALLLLGGAVLLRRRR